MQDLINLPVMLRGWVSCSGPEEPWRPGTPQRGAELPCARSACLRTHLRLHFTRTADRWGGGGVGRREEKSGDEVSGLNERGWEGQKEGISVWDSVPWWAGRLWEMRGWKYRCWGQEGGPGEKFSKREKGGCGGRNRSSLQARPWHCGCCAHTAFRTHRSLD